MRLVLGAAAAAIGMCALFAATESSAQNGSFRGSCRNISTLGGGFISAECADGSGRWRSSTINAGACVGDIGNQGGMLACNGASASGGAYVNDNSNRDRDRNRNSGYGGGYNGGGYGDNSRYGDRDRYDDRGGRGSRGGGISGSYQDSCRRYGTVEGGYLTAECASGGGRYRESTIQYTRCRSDISNQGGMLACEGAMATGGRYINDDRW